jgi:hypothetical protein
MPCDLSPRPSPEGPTSSQTMDGPPPVKKSAAARCLHELQDPASPTKPRKLCRTDSLVNMPVVSLPDSVVFVPIDLNNCLTDSPHFTTEFENLDTVLDVYQPEDPKGKAPMDIDPRPGRCSLISSMRKKGPKGSSSGHNSGSIPEILNTPTTSKKMPFDPRVTPDAKGLFDLAFGLYENDD